MSARKQPLYRPLAEYLALVPGNVGRQLRILYRDHRDRFDRSPGSSSAHQAWTDTSGYLGHVADCCNIAAVLYEALTALRPLPFALSDVVLVLALHDIEKPFKYVSTEEPLRLGDQEYTPETLGELLASKAGRKRFRGELLDQYGITLTPEQENALRYAEGEGEDYTPGHRVMGPLGALIHSVDVLSARLWFDYPAPEDTWFGAGLVGRRDPGFGLSYLPVSEEG